MDIARTSPAIDLQKYITFNMSVKILVAICYTSLAILDKRSLHCTTLTPATNSNLTGMHSALPTFTTAQHNHCLPDLCTSHRRTTHKKVRPPAYPCRGHTHLLRPLPTTTYPPFDRMGWRLNQHLTRIRTLSDDLGNHREET